MSDSFLAFFLPGFTLINFQPQNEIIELTAQAISLSAACPQCGLLSHRVHSYYTRNPKDLSIAGYALQLHLQLRRFRCLNPECSAVTFAERLPALVAPSAQRTLRLQATLRKLGLALGGEAGARYAQGTATPTSPDTLLRLVRQMPLPTPATPRVLGVDDFALKRGRIYGTILVDGESHRPIELLSDRTADSLAEWLRQHPGVEIITRDRSTEYARGASDGAPSAIQVADRWHLLVNLREALERMLEPLRPALQLTLISSSTRAGAELEPLSIYDRERRRGTKDQLAHQASRAKRYELYSTIKNLQHQGRNILQIARELKISRQTVRRYLGQAEFVEYPRPPRQKSILDPYVAYLQKRWEAGCHDMVQLWDEIKQQGYAGSIRPVVQWTTLRRERLLGGPSGKGRHPVRQVEIFSVPQAAPVRAASINPLPSSRRLVWLLLRAHSELNAFELSLFEKLRSHPQIEKAYLLAQQFVKMVRERNPVALSVWLAECQSSQISELINFAVGLAREERVIRAALEFSYSNGVSEGHVNRIKMIRRTMYGRGSFELLRRRVLAA
jgi:transposase